MTFPYRWDNYKTYTTDYTTTPTKFMESGQSFSTNTLGFWYLLPSELIQYIMLHLVLPDMLLLKSVNKTISSTIYDQYFVNEYNLRSSTATWLYVYKKRWNHDAILHGFSDRSNRWFKILINDVLRPVIPRGEDLYFLTSSGNFFLFALNNRQEVIAVNPMAKTVKKIPPTPLGRRSTCEWRRSGMKLLSGPPGSGNFRFMFAEVDQGYPTVFVYSSNTDAWQSFRGRENEEDNVKENDRIILSVSNDRNGSVLVSVGSQCDTPVVVRPGLDGVIQRFAVGFSSQNANDGLHVYGDGNMMIVRSDGVEVDSRRTRTLKSIEMWTLSPSGGQWELISTVPDGLVDKIKKPYSVMMGCVEEREGRIRGALMSNLEGIWDIIWLCYDKNIKCWGWVPLPDCKMKGSNMSGITFSSGLTLC